ncbi:MAG: hypothetical protein GY941_23545 [Planctomycetes bacterium]|nr:hypothetical protein [Planctomycetota bacterium]
MHITEVGIKKGKEMFHELKDDCDGSYVGAESKDTFEFNRETYKIEIAAFWEKTNHFEWLIEGDDYRQTGTYSL